MPEQTEKPTLLSVCKIEGCDKPRWARGWCCTHYRRWQRHGDVAEQVAVVELIKHPLARFYSKIAFPPVCGDRCWPWLAGLTTEGYGQFYHAGRNSLAHRVAYEHWRGPIPDGLTLDHLCRNRACVNPSHLEPVTYRQNTLRGRTLPAENVRKTHCPQGHPYDEANTYRTSGGYRQCRTCNRERTKRHEARRAA